jgi:hypothetical protein
MLLSARLVLSALVLLLVAFIVALVGGCGESPRARTEREAADDAAECESRLDRVIMAYQGPRSNFCAEVQSKANDVIRSDPVCRRVYPGLAPELCRRARPLDLDGGA